MLSGVTHMTISLVVIMFELTGGVATVGFTRVEVAVWLPLRVLRIACVPLLIGGGIGGRKETGCVAYWHGRHCRRDRHAWA